jgi:hypothetical protein
MPLSSAIPPLLKTGILSLPAPLTGIREPQTAEYERTVKTYRALVQRIDELLLHEAATTITTTSNGREEEEEEGVSLQEAQDTMHLRRLVIEETLITLPVLRGIHQVEGIPREEAQLGEKAMLMGELSLEVIRLMKSVEEKEKALNALKMENRQIQREIDSSVDRNAVEHKDPVDTTEPVEPRALARAKEKTFTLTEEIHALIITHGLNWNDDEELRNIVLYCSDIYK